MDASSMALARERADAGIEAAADKAERVEEGWLDLALQALRMCARKRKAVALFPFTVEELREEVERLTPRPDGVDGRVWGALTRSASRAGYIEATGGYAPAASSNGSPKRLYRAGVNA